MKKLLVYLFFTFALPAIGTLIFYRDFKNIDNEIKLNMHYIMTPSKEQNDIVLIGNSRTFVNIDPCVIDSMTGRKAYNLGLDGSTIPFFNMVLCKYLQRHPSPKYVVINVDFSGLNTEMEVYNYPDYYEYLSDSVVSACLLPYYSEFQNGLLNEISYVRQINSKPDEYKMAYFAHIVKHIKNNEGDHLDANRGFSPHPGKWQENGHKIKEYQAKYTSKGFDLMRQMIAMCKSRGIKVILICPPLYKDYHDIITNYNVVIDSVQHIAAASQVPYWVYSDTYIGDTTAYFYNVEHLNSTGAAVFSQMLGQDIKKYMADTTYVPDMEARKKN